MAQWATYEDAVEELSSLPGEERLGAFIATWTGEAESLSSEDVRRLFVELWPGGRGAVDDRSPELLRMLLWIAPVRDAETYLNGTLTVFRRAPDERGVSWTLDEPSSERATPNGSSLFRATVAASDVLAHFTTHGDNEVLVDPRSLGSLERLPPA